MRAVHLVSMVLLLTGGIHGEACAAEPLLSHDAIAHAAHLFTQQRNHRLMREYMVLGSVASMVVVSMLIRRVAYTKGNAASVDRSKAVPIDTATVAVPVVLPSAIVTDGVSDSPRGFVGRLLAATWCSITDFSTWLGRDVIVASAVSGAVGGFVRQILSPFYTRLIGGTSAVSPSISWFIKTQHGVGAQTYVVVSPDLYLFIGELLGWDMELDQLQRVIEERRATDLVRRHLDRLVRRAERICAHIMSIQQLLVGYEHELLADYYQEIESTYTRVLAGAYHALDQAELCHDTMLSGVSHLQWYGDLAVQVRNSLRLLHAISAYRIESYPLHTALYEVLQMFIATSISKNEVLSE